MSRNLSLLFVFIAILQAPARGQDEAIDGGKVVAVLRELAGRDHWFGTYMHRLSIGTLRCRVTAPAEGADLEMEWRVSLPAEMFCRWRVVYDGQGRITSWEDESTRPGGRAFAQLTRGGDGRLHGSLQARQGDSERKVAISMEAPPGALPSKALAFIAPRLAETGARVYRYPGVRSDPHALRFDEPSRETFDLRGSRHEIIRYRLRAKDEDGYETVYTCGALDGQTIQFQESEGQFLMFVGGTEAEVRSNLPYPPGEEAPARIAGEFLEALVARNESALAACLDASSMDEPTRARLAHEWAARVPPGLADVNPTYALKANQFAAGLKIELEGDRATVDGGEVGTIRLVRRETGWWVEKLEGR